MGFGIDQPQRLGGIHGKAETSANISEDWCTLEDLTADAPAEEPSSQTKTSEPAANNGDREGVPRPEGVHDGERLST